ncbi:MAG: LysM peptidoglycan-binding domain-containing protein [Mediterraneibacter gnavus]
MRKKKKMSAVITLILFCGCFLFGSFLSFAQNSRTEEPVQFKCYKSIVIQEGDSLWSLAERHIDSESETAVKEYIKELKQINQLESETIQTGEHLIIRITQQNFHNNCFYIIQISFTPHVIDINSLQKRNAVRQIELICTAAFLFYKSIESMNHILYNISVKQKKIKTGTERR